MADKFKRWYCIEFEEVTPDYDKAEIVHGPIIQPFVSNLPESQIEEGEPIFFGSGSLTDRRKQAKIVFIHANEYSCELGARKATECEQCSPKPIQRNRKGQIKHLKYKRNTCQGKCRRVLNRYKLSTIFFESNKNTAKSIDPDCIFTRKLAVLITFGKSDLIKCVLNLCNGCDNCIEDTWESALGPGPYTCPVESSGIPGKNLAERNIFLPKMGNSVFIGRFWTEILYIPGEKDRTSATAKDVAEMLVCDIAVRISWTSRAMEFNDIVIAVQKFAEVSRDVAIEAVEAEYAAVFDKLCAEEIIEEVEYAEGNNKEESNKEENKKVKIVKKEDQNEDEDEDSDGIEFSLFL